MGRLPELPAEPELEIDTDRLRLRPMEPDDAVAMFAVLRDPLLYAHTGGVPPESAETLHETYAARQARRSPDGTALWLNWIARERTWPGDPVGYVQATVTADHAELAWVVGSPWQNRGYASEAASAIICWLRTLGCTTLRAKIHPRHAASQRVAARAGMQRTSQSSDGEEIWSLVTEKPGMPGQNQ
ncbi:MAG: GNAT family N-acetyltransferase [Gammaproteobacteria bacterium]|jgi:RimJ/RimL family protein N-acetyltransferase|nr:GNAT family N-acetyltransferase [Gammaproteobacteria bacterium]